MQGSASCKAATHTHIVNVDPTSNTTESKVEALADNAARANATSGRALTSSASLLHLLPTGSVLAFQELAATFTNQGNCYPSNWWLTLGLVTFLTATCIFFAFTDSVVYHGVALPGRLLVFNLSKDEHDEVFLLAGLKERGLEHVGGVHAFFTAVVFLTIAGNVDPASNAAARTEETNAGRASVAADRVLTSSVNLLQLLPTGAVLAFQTLSATSTNQGNCYRSNWWLTVGLITFLSAICIFFAFTDSVDYNGKVYHGVVLKGRLHVLNLSKEQADEILPELQKRGLKPVDWVHAFFSAVVFLTIAGSDVGLQHCFFPRASEDTKQLLKNLPLGMAVISSFVFMIFPTTRKGMGFNNSDYSIISAPPAASVAHNTSGKVTPDPENPARPSQPPTSPSQTSAPSG